MPLSEMAGLFSSLHIGVAPGLIRVKTDPSDRTYLRLIVGSQDPSTTNELKEYVKEQLIDIRSLTPVHSVAPTPASGMPALMGLTAVLMGLILYFSRIHFPQFGIALADITLGPPWPHSEFIHLGRSHD
ncbi:hypothetical protein M758_7G158900 [Ceratodon purpureus]|nr:hypothetical protein M758_7G158900 [Ceratodon purpureus]